jgi:DnaJ-class molecular chaperone
MEKKISLSEALTGFTFSVKHLDGSKLEVATMPGEVISHD